MRVVVSHLISLDGVIQAPGEPQEDLDGGFRHGGWSRPYFDNDAMGLALDDTIDGATALLFGRRTFEAIGGTRPQPGAESIVDKLIAIPKFVASRTLLESDVTWPNTTLLTGDTAMTELRRMKLEPGGDVVVLGSATLARQLIAEGFVDEYRLMIEPILLGGGKRLFPDDAWSRPLELVSATTTATGVLMCTYRPV